MRLLELQDSEMSLILQLLEEYRKKISNNDRLTLDDRLTLAKINAIKQEIERNRG